MKILHVCAFFVRMVVCYNHPSDTSAFHDLLTAFDNNNDNLCVTIDIKKIYVSFDTAYLNKLEKDSSFSPFQFNQFFVSINLDGAE